MKHPSQVKWSIMIMVIIILVTISILWLLVMNYVQNMIQLSSNFFAYNKAYYLARGVAEFQLTKVAHRQVGFQDEIDLWSTFDCFAGTRANSSNLCTASSIIKAKGTFFANSFGDSECTSGNAYQLEGGDALWFPLFHDVDSSAWPFETKPKLTSLYYPDIEVLPSFASDDHEIGVALIRMDKDALSDKWVLPPTEKFSRSKTSNLDEINWENVVTFIFSPGDSPPAPNIGAEDSVIYYLVVFNPSSGTSDILSFCLQSDDAIPYTILSVESIATFKGTSVWLQSTQNIDLPGFIFSTFVKR